MQSVSMNSATYLTYAVNCYASIYFRPKHGGFMTRGDTEDHDFFQNYFRIDARSYDFVNICQNFGKNSGKTSIARSFSLGIDL